MVLATQEELDRLARRIRTAYLRRGVRWTEACSTSRVWSAAATTLWQCRVDHPELPIDPELFVASQGVRPEAADPWRDLASPRAAKLYRASIRMIVRQLRRELAREIRRAERLIQGGRTPAAVVRGRDARLSPIGRYIVALRASRPDLAESWNDGVLAQHRSCPLYRLAAHEYLAPEEYPTAREAAPPVVVAPDPLPIASQN